jgi:single-stranded-DNA-specific exonuclease
VEEFNLISAIEACSSSLDKYGGHPMACGFSVTSEAKLQEFQTKIRAVAAERLQGLVLQPKLKIEAALNLTEIDLELAGAINSLAPFGQNNPQPRFVSYDVRLDDVVTMGLDGQHLKLRLSAVDPLTQRAKAWWAVGFGLAQEYKELKPGDHIDLVYYLEVNDFNGHREPQLKIIDIKI